MDQARRGYFSLCAHWFFATGALGVFYPYFALFLRENVGLTGTQVGLLVAIPPLVGVIAQPLWGQLADRTGSRVRVLAVLCVGTALGYCALRFSGGLASTALATTLLASFLSALFPMSISVTFALLRDSGDFGRVRVWGTLGYLLVVVATPELLHALRERGVISVSAALQPNRASEPGLEHMFLLAALLVLLGAVVLRGLPRARALELRAERSDLRALLAHSPYVRLLVFSVIVQLVLHGPMLLFPLYVRSRGGSMTDLSHLWIWMVVLEVPLIVGSGRLRSLLGAPRMIGVAALAGGARWLVCALLPSMQFVAPVQALHAVVVTGLGVGTALYVEQIVPPALRSTGQSLVIMAGSSLGGVASSVLGGVIVDRHGVDALYLAGGVGGLLVALLSLRLLGAPAGTARAPVTPDVVA